MPRLVSVGHPASHTTGAVRRPWPQSGRTWHYRAGPFFEAAIETATFVSCRGLGPRFARPPRTALGTPSRPGKLSRTSAGTLCALDSCTKTHVSERVASPRPAKPSPRRPWLSEVCRCAPPRRNRGHRRWSVARAAPRTADAWRVSLRDWAPASRVTSYPGKTNEYGWCFDTWRCT